MDPRAQEIIDTLQLEAHPEGGRYRRIFESQHTVLREDTGAQRLALTSICYLLLEGESSTWHRVTSDEAWHFYEGAELELRVASPDAIRLQVLRLGRLQPLPSGCRPVHVVPAGAWQCARSTGTYSLVGCSVGPGFDFADFTMARDLGDEALRARLAGLL